METERVYKPAIKEIVSNLEDSLTNFIPLLEEKNGAEALVNIFEITFLFGLGGIKQMCEILALFEHEDKELRKELIYTLEEILKGNKVRFKEQETALKEALKVAKSKLKAVK